ncbi:Replicative DNA helicase [Candidatus Hepatincolaceae symbiont of Richtersius coronifer]
MEKSSKALFETEKFSNIQAEKALLGFIILNNNSFEEISEILVADYFFLDLHKKIFSIIKKLFDKSQVADLITVSNFASYSKEYQDLTFDYLVELTNSVVSFGSSKDYAALIYDLYLKRQILILQSNISNYLTVGETSTEQIQRIEKDVFNLAEKGIIEGNIDNFESALNKALAAAVLAKKYSNGLSGVTTGLLDLDNKLGGLQRSDLIVLAARPSMGKTALATNIAFNAASTYVEKNGYPGAPVVIFSLEMASEQIASRILASQVSTSSDAIRKGMLSDADFSRLSAAVGMLKNTPIFIDDTPGATINHIRTKCRRLKRKHDLGLIIIDYIQLIGSERRNDNRVAEVSEITRGLKGIAKELNVPVLALSQLSRAVETREDKKPMLSDLRESGSIEQDADVVAFIFREEYYLSREEPQMAKKDESNEKFKIRYEQWQKNYEASKNKATVIISKNRHGPIGNVELLFNAAKTEFVNFDKVHSLKSLSPSNNKIPSTATLPPAPKMLPS